MTETFAIAIGSSIVALGSWYYIAHDNQRQLWDYLISVNLVIFMIGPFFSSFLKWSYINDDEEQLGYYQRSTIAVFSTIELFLLVFGGCYDVY